jgi:topoisomerase-4 subunit A
LASGAKISHALCGHKDTQVLLSTSGGYGFTCGIGDMIARNKAGKQFITVAAGKETILPPVIFVQTEYSLVAVLSKQARLLLFSLSELKALPGGGKGMMLMDLKEGDELVGAQVISQPELLVTGMSGTKLQQLRIADAELQDYFGRRARAGKAIATKLKSLQF